MTFNTTDAPSGRPPASQATFTPGPWEVLHDAGYGEVPGFCVDGGQFVVALAIGDVEVLPAEANARLIAAAPELYEALQVCVQICAKPLGKPMNLAGQSPLDIAVAALAKARGETL